MKIAAILIFVLASHATGSPVPDPFLGIDLPSLPSPGGLISSLTNIVGTVLGGLKNSLSLAGDGLVNGRFLENLKLDIQNKLEAGGQVTEKILRNVVINTLDLAVGNKVFESVVSAKISLTFKLGNPAAVEPLTKETIESLVITGDEEAAEQFKSDLNVVLKAHQAGDSSLKVIAGLQHSLIDLLSGNAVMKAKGALDLKSYFNLPALVGGFKGALGNRINSIIQGAVQSAQLFIDHLKEGLQSKVDAVAFDHIAGIVSKIMNEANNKDLLGGGTISKLKSTFAELGLGSSALAQADIDTLTVNGDPKAATKFKTTVKTLRHLKTEGYADIAILSGLGSAVMDLLTENNAIKSKSLLLFAQNLMINAVVDLLNDASKVSTALKAQLAGNAAVGARFLTRMTPFLQRKVADSGKLTPELLSKVVSTVLNLATGNKILTLEPAARISASFGNYIGLDIEPLQLADVDTLPIGGDTRAATQFRAVIKDLLRIVAKGSPSVSTLAGVVDAIMDLVVANGVIGSAAANGLTAYFTS